MANITAFLTACKVKGLRSRNDQATDLRDYTLYCPKTTHTWIEKAVLCFGFSSGGVAMDRCNGYESNRYQSS